MAEAKGAPKVAYRHHVARGEHQLGVVLEGTFVPFAVLSNAYVAQLTENEHAAAGESDGEGEGGE